MAGLDFGTALTVLRSGHAATRTGWNGKGMFIYLVDAGAYPARSPVVRDYFGENALVQYQPYIAMKTADGTVVPWLASQSDILAEDWAALDYGEDA